MSDTSRKTARKTARKTPAKSAARKGAAAKKPVAGKTARKPAKPAGSKSPSAKHKHARLVRDSFTMPEDEYGLLAETKKACLTAGFEIKKSELIRIGIALVHELSTARIRKAQQSLQPVKTGRPKKQK